MRGLILKSLDLGGNGGKLGRNVIFDTGNVDRLAKHIYALRVDDKPPEDNEDEIEEMETMIRKYSTFTKHIPGSKSTPEGHVVVLTGSTGSLGAHVLALLLTRRDVRSVYCLVRGKIGQERVLKALRQRGLGAPDETRVVALACDLSREDLGLSPEMLDILKRETTSIIHRYALFHACAFKL